MFAKQGALGALLLHGKDGGVGAGFALRALRIGEGEGEGKRRKRSEERAWRHLAGVVLLKQWQCCPHFKYCSGARPWVADCGAGGLVVAWYTRVSWARHVYGKPSI